VSVIGGKLRVDLVYFLVEDVSQKIRDFADFMGWDAGMDAMGNVVLYTNIKK
jgi:hypothetical protein